MNILVYAPHQKNFKVADDIRLLLAKRSTDLLVLPGHSNNHPNLKILESIASQYQVSISTEIKQSRAPIPVVINSNSPLIELHEQTVVDSQQHEAIKEFHTILPNRVFMGEFLILMCGEINAINNSGSLKHGEFKFPKFIFNLVHHNMGHWNHLNEKYCNLSKGQKYAVHVTNNKYKSVTSSLKVFHDGKELLSSYYLLNNQRYAHISA